MSLLLLRFLPKLIFPWVLLWLFSISVEGQIQIDDNYSIPQLVQKLEGHGVRITNITSDCQSIRAKKPYGYFRDKKNKTGLKEGLLMTTGAAEFASGPNDAPWKTQKNGTNKVDEDLKALYDNPSAFYDLCVIEFDIEVFGEQLRFNYVFASEEYPEFVFEYNDGFGFFIEGPGLPKTNIALVPGKNDIVSINTINQYVNTEYFMLNSRDYYLQYDGFTTPLEAKINVVPCETYHIKLAITDYLDDRYDSGIFLESGSFRTEEDILSVVYQSDSLHWLFEGCGEADIIVKRYGMGKKDYSIGQTVKIKFEGDRNDLSYIPDEVFMPPGVDSVILKVSALKDSISESEDFLVLIIPGPCGEDDWLDIDTVWIREITVKNTRLPNVITPNNDGINDQLQFDGIESGVWQILIVNRNGQIVFLSPGYEHNWTGASLPSGVYYYHLKNPPGDREFKGWVQVIK